MVALALAGSAYAQIGWTLAQCEAKYGEAGIHHDSYFFDSPKVKRGGIWEVWVVFSDDNRATSVTYVSNNPYSAKLLQVLLAENTPGFVWEKWPTCWQAYTRFEEQQTEAYKKVHPRPQVDDPNGEYERIDYAPSFTAAVKQQNGYYFLAITPDEAIHHYEGEQEYKPGDWNYKAQ